MAAFIRRMMYVASWLTPRIVTLPSFRNRHARTRDAAIVAYPQLGVTGRPPDAVPSDWGLYANLYNVDDSTFASLDDVLDEVMALFPGSICTSGVIKPSKTSGKRPANPGADCVSSTWPTSRRCRVTLSNVSRST